VARRSGAYRDAEDHLAACEELQAEPDAVRLERALLHAQRGELPSLPVKTDNPLLVEISLRDPPAEMAAVRDYLQSCIAGDHAETSAILEAMAEGYMRNERPLSALSCVEQLLRREPFHIQGLLWHGELKEHYGEPGVALADYHRVLELDPERDEARLRLAESLLYAHNAPEALGHLELLRKRQPTNVAILLSLARCHRDLAHENEAQQILDDLLAAHPHHAGAALERGRLALRGGKAEAAEKWLRRAVDLQPYNRDANYSLGQCLERLGKSSDAKRFFTQADRIAADMRRLDEINKQLAVTPHDPSLRYEVGLLLLKNGQAQRGLTWLASALQEDPQHQPARQALADYYAQIGNQEMAAKYRLRGERGK